MISWIQATFQRHFKVVFVVLIVIMVIPMVFIYSTTGGVGTADQQVRKRIVFGRSLTTEQERRDFTVDSQVSMQLSTGQAFFSPEQTEAYGFYRAAKLAIADKYRIPAPTETQLVNFIMELPGFRGEDGKYDRQAYTRLLDSTRSNPVFTQARLNRVISEDWRASQATAILSGPGYALDPEIRETIAAVDTNWTVHSATLSTQDVKAEGEPDEAELQRWFSLNAEKYRNPPSTSVSVLAFSADRYGANLPPATDDEIARHFERNKSAYAAPAAPEGGDQPVVPSEPKLEDVRDRVKADLDRQRSINAATKAASDLAYTLFDKQIVRGSTAFDTLLTGQGLALQPMPPIPLLDRPSDPLLSEAAGLSEEKPVSDPVVIGSTAYLMFFDRRAEASDAQFALVRERVLADVQQDRRTRAVVARGEQLRAQVAAAVRAGSPFPEAAKAAGLEIKTWENFTRRNLPADFDRSLLARMNDQTVGEVSPMSVQGAQGSFIFVAQRKEPVISSDDPNYAEARRTLMAQTQQLTAHLILTDMVRAERIAAGLDEPAAPSAN